MTPEEIKQYIINLVMVFVGGVVTWSVQNILPRQKREDLHDEFQNKTIETQGRTLADAWVMIEKLSRELQEERNARRTLEDHLDVVNSYLLANIEHMLRNGVKPLPVPEELKKNTKLIDMVNRMKDVRPDAPSATA